MRRFLLLLILLVALDCHAGDTRRYRLTLRFTEPDFRWTRIIAYRDEIHLILDDAPLGDGYWGYVAGVIYPKKGDLYLSLSLNKLRGKSETDGAALGRISHLKLPPKLTVAIPMTSGDFESCSATLVPIK